VNNYNFDGHKLVYHPDRVSQYLATNDCYPLYMEISPVGSCNHRCIFCAYDYIGYPNRKLETTITLELIDELAESGLRSILFAGEGEPLLHPDLHRFVKKAKDSGIDAGIFTNGQLLTPLQSEQLLPYLTFIRFSFNAGTRENYAQIHSVQPDVFDKVLSHIRSAAEFKQKNGLQVDIGAQFVLLPENLSSVTSAATTLRDIGADYLAIKPFVQQNELQGYHMSEQLPEDVLNDTLTELENLSTDTFAVLARKNAFEQYGKRAYSHCYGTSFITVLNSAGIISSCLPYWEQENFSFGSIYEKSFKHIWNGEKRRAIVKNLEQTLDVHSCPPNCRPNAINAFLSDIKNSDVKHINFI